MDEQTITYDDGQVRATIAAKRATIVAGVRRTRLQQHARAQVEGQQLDVDEWIAHTVLWPDVMACCGGQVTLADGSQHEMPVEWEVFRDLPEALTMEMVDAAYQVNPHWVEKDTAEEPSEEKKRATTS